MFQTRWDASTRRSACECAAPKSAAPTLPFLNWWLNSCQAVRLNSSPVIMRNQRLPPASYAASTHSASGSQACAGSWSPWWWLRSCRRSPPSSTAAPRSSPWTSGRSTGRGPRRESSSWWAGTSLSKNPSASIHRLFEWRWKRSALFQDCDCHPGGGERGVDPNPAVGQQRSAVCLHPVSDQLPRATHHCCLHSGRVLEEDQWTGNTQGENTTLKSLHRFM